MRRILFTGLAALAAASLPGPSAAAEDSTSRPPEVPAPVSAAASETVRLARTELTNSVHSTFECADCHAGAAGFDPPAALPKVACARCHTEAQAEYEQSVHFTSRSSDSPSCTDCHGTHDIRALADSASMVAPRHQAYTCSRCHSNPRIVEKHDIPIRDPLKAYQASVHGWLTLTEGRQAAVCGSCHGGHVILPAADPRSSVHRASIPATCGRCHEDEAAEFMESVHGRAVVRGITDAPDCNDCHSEHGVLRARAPASPTAPQNVAVETCGRCHASARIEQKFGLAKDRFSTFQDSFHGLALRSGNLSVANCASCHGVHNILPSSDPRSMIAPANLEGTCGNCHKEVTANFASGPVHMTGKDPGSRVNDMVRNIYIGLIVLVIGGMAVHNGLDFVRRSRDVLKRR